MWFTHIYTEEELKELVSDKLTLKVQVDKLEEFKIEDHHLFLLAQMTVEFEDFEDPYEGTFSIPSKRPFGSYSWSADIASMMGHKLPKDGDNDAYMVWYKENYLKYFKVYLEMGAVMQIAMQNARYPLEAGQVFVRRRGRGVWSLKD